MKNTRDCYKKLSEDRSLLANEILKISGSAKYYLEFYRLVLVVSLSLVYRGSTRKGTSTLRYCSNFSPLIGGGMEVDILPPSLPSRWIKSPGGSQIKSFKVFFQDLPGKILLEISFSCARQISARITTTQCTGTLARQSLCTPGTGSHSSTKTDKRTDEQTNSH